MKPPAVGSYAVVRDAGLHKENYNFVWIGTVVSTHAKLDVANRTRQKLYRKEYHPYLGGPNLMVGEVLRVEPDGRVAVRGTD